MRQLSCALLFTYGIKRFCNDTDVICLNIILVLFECYGMLLCVLFYEVVLEIFLFYQFLCCCIWLLVFSSLSFSPYSLVSNICCNVWSLAFLLVVFFFSHFLPYNLLVKHFFVMFGILHICSVFINTDLWSQIVSCTTTNVVMWSQMHTKAGSKILKDGI